MKIRRNGGLGMGKQMGVHRYQHFSNKEKDCVKNINKRSLEWGCKRVRSHHTRRRHMVQATLSPAAPQRELR